MESTRERYLNLAGGGKRNSLNIGSSHPGERQAVNQRKKRNATVFFLVPASDSLFYCKPVLTQ